MILTAALKITLVVHTMGNSTALEEQRIKVIPQQQSNWGICHQGQADCLQTYGYQLIASTESKPNEGEATNPAQNATEQASEPHEFWTMFNYRLKITDTLLVIFTLLLAVFTYLLVRVGWQQDSTTKQQNRSFVSMTQLNVFDRGAKWQAGKTKPVIIKADFRKLRVYVVIKNSGNTPAHRVAHSCGIFIRKLVDEKTIPIERPIQEISTSAIAPGGYMSKSFDHPERITEDELEAVRAGTSAIYVNGTIQYWDAFGKQHWTHYRLAWAGTYPFHPDTALSFCNNGNDAD